MTRPHYRGDYQRRAKAVRLAAYADPATKCWRCGRTLAEHPRHKSGAPARWTAGHTTDGMVGGELKPEVSTCNYHEGARLGARRNRGLRTTRSW